MNLNLSRSLRSYVTSTALVLAAAATGCSASSGDDLVKGHLVVSGSQSALSADDLAALSLEGTYGAGCDGHDAASTWTSDDVSVRKNDFDCVLTITGIDIGDAQLHAESGIALEEQFAPSARAYVDQNGAKQFYANAKISDASFGGDFVITVLTSASTSASSDTGESTGEYATEGGTVSAGAVDPPAYGATIAPLHVLLDANDVVLGVSGYVQLLPGGDADRFAVLPGAVDPTWFEDVDEAFGAGVPLSSLEDMQIPASYFAGLQGHDLDTNEIWTLMLRNEEEGVRSYQVLYVTFAP